MAPVAVLARVASVRRRRRQRGSIHRASFTLHEHVVLSAKEAVAQGLAPNLSAFVEEALEEKLRRTRRATLYAAYEDAAKDSCFVAEMDEVDRSFGVALRDGLGDETLMSRQSNAS